MKCQRCGCELKPNAKFCENCGLFAGIKSFHTKLPTQQTVASDFKYTPQQGVNGIHTAQTKSKGLPSWVIVLIVIGSVMLLCFLIVECNNCIKENKLTNKRNEFLIAKEDCENYWEEYCKDNYSDIIEVSISHLHDNDDFYEGKNILTVAQIDEMNTDSFSTEVQNEGLFFDGAIFQFKQYSDELLYYQEGERVIIVGTVDGESTAWADVCIKDCHIVGSGEVAYAKAKALNELDYSYETTVPSTTLDD